MFKSRTVALATVLSLAGAAAHAQPQAGASAAAGEWAKSHPRRAEVNTRLANQNKRIKEKVSEGEMSLGKADRLRREDRQIRQRSAPWPHRTGVTSPRQSKRA